MFSKISSKEEATERFDFWSELAKFLALRTPKDFNSRHIQTFAGKPLFRKGKNG